jgi:hypothetical protein
MGIFLGTASVLVLDGTALPHSQQHFLQLLHVRLVKKVTKVALSELHYLIQLVDPLLCARCHLRHSSAPIDSSPCLAHYNFQCTISSTSTSTID